MREERSGAWKNGLWASLSEGRAPLDEEVESIAAKIWRDVYRRDKPLMWGEVEVGSPPHRKSIAAACAALGSPRERS